VELSRPRIVALAARSDDPAALLAAGADRVDPDDGGPSIETAGEAAAAVIAGATELRTHEPRAVRRAVDLVLVLRAERQR
jgi:hypothetical protein